MLGASHKALLITFPKGWNNPEGDTHFKSQRQLADNPSWKERRGFYNMMQRIGDEMQAATGVLSLPEPRAHVLDVCIAPGGYSASALKYSPHAQVKGITLNGNLGGHQMLIPFGKRDPRVEVKFADVTMFAAECDATDIPMDHPDSSSFSFNRPWVTTSFDLVVCDGQVLRTHARHIASYREQCEATRLTCSQLILAMQRIKPGGTFIMLLHKVEMWRVVKLLSIFDNISEVALFKPMTCHRARGSFYLIAKNVQPQAPKALAAIDEWKVAWRNATFPQYRDLQDFVEKETVDEEVARVLASFGERLITLGEPVWRIQKDALKNASWFKNKNATLVGDSSPRAALTETSASRTAAAMTDPSPLTEEL